MIWNQQNCNDTSRCKPFFGWWRRCIITKRRRFTKSIWYLWLHAKNASYLRCLVAFHRLFIACERKSYCIQSQLCKLSVVLKHSANVYAFQYTFNTFFKWLSELQRYDYFRANILKFEIIVYCYNIVPVKKHNDRVYKPWVSRWVDVFAHKFLMNGLRRRREPHAKSMIRCGLDRNFGQKMRRDFYFDCFYIPLLFLVPCILAAFFRVFLVRNKKKARTNEVVIIFVVAEWTVFSKKNWDVEGFERLICSQMFLNSWLLIPLSFSSLLICSLILDF